MDSVNDRNFKFTRTYWTHVLWKRGTKLSLSSLDYPQSNKQTKQVNQIVEDILCGYFTRKPSHL